MYNLQSLIDKQLISRTLVNGLIAKSYTPCLKPISCSSNTNQLIIYSHAPINLLVIEQLALLFKIPFQDHSREELAHTISKIRKQFKKYVASESVNTLYDTTKIGSFSHLLPYQKSAIESITWNRHYSFLKRDITPWGNSFFVSYVHGHDPTYSSSGNVFNLDNNLGKLPGESKGIYSVLITDATLVDIDSFD